MGFPLMLFGLAPIVNSSFEADAGGAAPSGWEIASSVNGVNSVSSTEFHSAGAGIPSARSLKQNVTAGTAGNKAVARQRFAPTDLLALLKLTGTELAAAAMFNPATQDAHTNATLTLEQYSGGSATPGSGALVAPPFTRSFEAGAFPWILKVTAITIDPATVWVDLVLRYDLVAGYAAGNDVWWDRVFLGGLLDLHKGFRKVDPVLMAGYSANEGDGSLEIVRTRRPRTELGLQLGNIADGCEDDLQIKAFMRWMHGSAPGPLALWVDREQHTNVGRHFQLCYQDPKFKIDLPSGFLRANYDFDLVAPSEAA